MRSYSLDLAPIIVTLSLTSGTVTEEAWGGTTSLVSSWHGPKPNDIDHSRSRMLFSRIFQAPQSALQSSIIRVALVLNLVDLLLLLLLLVLLMTHDLLNCFG